MAEPSSTGVGIAAALLAVLGPVFGPMALICWGALAGAMWPLAKRRAAAAASRRRPGPRLDGALFLLRVVLTASVLTIPAAVVVESFWHVPAYHAWGLLAFFIGMCGDDLPALLRPLGKGLFRRIRLVWTGGAAKETE